MKFLITLFILLSILSYQVMSQDILKFKKDQRPVDGALTELALSFDEQANSMTIFLVSTPARTRIDGEPTKPTVLFDQSLMKCTGTFSKEFKGMIHHFHCYKKVENEDYNFVGFQLRINKRKLYDAYSYTKDYSRVKPTLNKLVSDLEIVIED